MRKKWCSNDKSENRIVQDGESWTYLLFCIGSSSQYHEVTKAQIWATNQKVDIGIPLSLPASFPKPDFIHTAFINLVCVCSLCEMLSCSAKFPYGGYATGINCLLVQTTKNWPTQYENQNYSHKHLHLNFFYIILN